MNTWIKNKVREEILGLLAAGEMEGGIAFRYRTVSLFFFIACPELAGRSFGCQHRRSFHVASLFFSMFRNYKRPLFTVNVFLAFLWQLVEQITGKQSNSDKDGRCVSLLEQIWFSVLKLSADRGSKTPRSVRYPIFESGHRRDRSWNGRGSISRR